MVTRRELPAAAIAATLILLRVPHPHAGATTLIVSLGILTSPWQLAVLMLAGIPYPLWSAPAPAKT